MTDDIVTRLRAEQVSWLDPTVPVWDENAAQIYGDAADEIERLRAVIDAVANLHDFDHVDDPRCTECGEWPCSTHLIVCQECKEARRG